MSSGIYEIRNMVNGKRYIGSSVNLEARKRCHFSMLKRNKHNSVHLQRAFNESGEENFVFTVLYECQPEELIRCEQEELDLLKPEYNIRQIADNNTGVILREETRKLMSEVKMGERNSFFGKHHSDKTKAILSKKTSENNSGENAFWYGKHMPIEARKKLSAYHTGLKASEETKKKISLAFSGSNHPLYGTRLSDEQKLKQSLSMKQTLLRKKMEHWQEVT